MDTIDPSYKFGYKIGWLGGWVGADVNEWVSKVILKGSVTIFVRVTPPYHMI